VDEILGEMGWGEAHERIIRFVVLACGRTVLNGGFRSLIAFSYKFVNGQHTVQILSNVLTETA